MAERWLRHMFTDADNNFEDLQTWKARFLPASETAYHILHGFIGQCFTAAEEAVGTPPVKVPA